MFLSSFLLTFFSLLCNPVIFLAVFMTQQSKPGMMCVADGSGGEQGMPPPSPALLRCVGSPSPPMEYLCPLRCFHSVADSDSILAIQSKNWTHIHRLRNLIHQTSRSLLLALEAEGWGWGDGCDSVVELWLPCTESFLPQREREIGWG